MKKDSFSYHIKLGKEVTLVAIKVNTKTCISNSATSCYDETDEEKKKQKNFKILYPQTMHQRTLSRVKSQSMEWGKNIRISHSYTGLISRI